MARDRVPPPGAAAGVVPPSGSRRALRIQGEQAAVGRRTGQACSGPKGSTRALRDLGLFRCDRDTHAATLTTLDGALSLKFEQATPLPGDRIAALRGSSPDFRG
jgi:hypothetical protein